MNKFVVCSVLLFLGAFFTSCGKDDEVTMPNTPGGNSSDAISFADPTVKELLIRAGLDRDFNGEISYSEATSIVNFLFGGNSSIFYESKIESFDEFRFFRAFYTIGSMTFFGCTNLKSIILPNSIERIESAAFYGCTALENIEIPSHVKSIEGGAFHGCTKLSTIKLPSSITTIESGTFRDCIGLTNIEIPESIISIAGDAFYGCTGLESISVEENNKTYDSRENCNAIIETASNKLIIGCKNTRIPHTVTTIEGSAFYKCIGLASIEIPLSVKKIGYAAFKECTKLDGIKIPTSVASIGRQAFMGCTGMTSIDIATSIKEIDDETFRDCKGLKSVTIPNSVTWIGNNVFYGCVGLNSVTCLAIDPPQLYETLTLATCFDNTNNCPIYVPAESVNKYKTGWWNYRDRIRPIK